MTIATAPMIRAPRGNQLRCKGWQQEAALRCLMNNLDPEVAERPADLVVYGGIGRAARNWECFHAIVRELEHLGNEETLLVQSGKPVASFPPTTWLRASSSPTRTWSGKWANWEHFLRTRPQGPDDVRPDDRGQLDLHRHAGHPAGHIPDLRRAGRAALRRLPRRASSSSPAAWAAWAERSRCRSR